MADTKTCDKCGGAYSGDSCTRIDCGYWTAKRAARAPLLDSQVSEDALKQMRERGGTWAAYQNHDLGHPLLGHLTFLRVGEGCTFTTAPDRMPDTQQAIGWRYLHVGFVDLATGEIKEGA